MVDAGDGLLGIGLLLAGGLLSFLAWIHVRLDKLEKAQYFERGLRAAAKEAVKERFEMEEGQ